MMLSDPDMSRGKPGLAALALAWQQGGDALLAPVAQWLGYERKQDSAREKKQPEPHSSSNGINKETTPLEEQRETTHPPAGSYLPWPFWRVTARTELPEPKQSAPAWLHDTSSPPSDTGAHTRTAPPKQLVAMKRLWPMLINDLSRARRTSRPDIQKIIKTVAQGRPMPVRLRKWQNSWAEDIHIIVDTSSHLFPFRADFMRLVEKMNNRIGSRRLKILRFTDYPGGAWQGWYLDDSPGADIYIPPSEYGCVLILGDLDALKSGGEVSPAWAGFITKLNGRKLKVFVFSPAAGQNCSAELRRKAAIQPWDDRALFSRHIGAGRQGKGLRSQKDEQEEEQKLKELQVMLSCTALFTPGLLRTLRTRFLPHSSAALESNIWEMNDIFILSGSFAAWQKEQVQPFREMFRKKPPQWKKDVLQTVVESFKGFPADFLAVQQVIGASLTGQDAKQARSTLKAIIGRAWRAESGISSLTCSFLRFFLENQDQADWEQDDDLLHTAYPVAYREELEQGFPDTLPAGCDPDKIRWAIGDESSGFMVVAQAEQMLRCRAFQTGEQSIIRGLTDQRYIVRGQPLYRIKNGPWRPVDNAFSLSPQQEPVQFHTGREILECTCFQKPGWASRVGRDRFGLFADLEIQGIIQRFRWLEPGSFMMGSPEDEPERLDEETQYKVILNQGFWLADSTVAQELWQLVMGKNPSNFKSRQRPVETVSWEDIRKFIDKLNKLMPGLSVCLPTETQWEYGCRAGSITPFSFGDTITPEQVNYDGNYPYNDGKKGAYREQTVAVKTLPCNAWGLYEMHGNVWEWCQDWFLEDLGPEEGGNRVVRGGSWLNYGRFVRSAIRVRAHPGDRRDYIGFRLARGH